MPEIIRNAPAGMRQALLLVAAAISLVFATPALAVEVVELYSAEVDVDPEDPDSLDSAYERALQQVLVRITGSEAAAYSPDLAELFPNPARFVMRYRPLPDNGLWVALDGAAIEQVLRQRGLPVWSSERPLTMVWLAVDWGGGRRELLTVTDAGDEVGSSVAATRSERIIQRVQSVATTRGVPIRFPDAAAVADLDVSLSDIWGGFHDGLLDASRDSGAISVLVGRARPGNPERSRWSYYSAGQRQQWNGDVEDALHLLADTLAAQFAVAGNEPLAVVELTIDNVRTAAGYAAVQKMMGDMQVADGYQLVSVEGDRLRYSVRINGGARRLAGALGFNGELQAVAAEAEGTRPPDERSLQYVYRP